MIGRTVAGMNVGLAGKALRRVKITCNARGPGRRINSDGNARGLRGRANSHPTTPSSRYRP